jgi:GNAT superfamily N-acetyltransferase
MPMQKFKFHPLTLDRWDDFETLFGERGACGGCWCMTWRLARSQFDRQKGSGNKRTMKKLVTHGPPPGILAYAGKEPVGWCSVAPRQDFPALKRSRVLKPVDDKLVWSITCLFIAKPLRNQGLSARLLKTAVEFAGKSGATIVEGYPYDLTGKTSPLPDPFVWTGLISAYQKAGFAEVARRSPTRPIMRKQIRHQ